MKFVYYTVHGCILCAVLFLILIAGCSKSNNNPTSPVNTNQINTAILNGGPFKNAQISLVSLGGEYVISSNFTAVILRGLVNTDTVYVGVVFPGTQTGNFGWQNANSDSSNSGCVLTIGYFTNPDELFVSDGSAGSTNITGYGKVGQTIDGSISGKVVSTTNTSVTISGNFSVFRVPDVDNGGGGIKRKVLQKLHL